MRCARWLGQRDRFNIDLEIDDVRYTVELQAIAVHVEPEKIWRLHDSMSARGAQTLNDLVLTECCRRINADG